MTLAPSLRLVSVVGLICSAGWCHAADTPPDPLEGKWWGMVGSPTDRAVGSEPHEIRHLGSLTAMDRKTGKVTWRWPMPEWPGSLLNGFAAPPIIDGKTLFIGGVDGCLYAFPIG